MRDILERTTGAFINTDIPLARSVEPLEEVIDGLNKTVKNIIGSVWQGKMHDRTWTGTSDLGMNYELDVDHCPISQYI